MAVASVAMIPIFAVIRIVKSYQDPEYSGLSFGLVSGFFFSCNRKYKKASFHWSEIFYMNIFEQLFPSGQIKQEVPG